MPRQPSRRNPSSATSPGRQPPPGSAGSWWTRARSSAPFPCSRPPCRWPSPSVTSRCWRRSWRTCRAATCAWDDRQGDRGGGSGIADRRAAQPRAIVAEAFVNKGSASTSPGADASQSRSNRRRSRWPWPDRTEFRDARPQQLRFLRLRGRPGSRHAPPPRGERAGTTGRRSRDVQLDARDGRHRALYSQGRDWDTHDALDARGVRAGHAPARSVADGILLSPQRDRSRRTPRRPGREITELVGDCTEPDDLFSLYMARGNVALVTGRPRAAYREAMRRFT